MLIIEAFSNINNLQIYLLNPKEEKNVIVVSENKLIGRYTTDLNGEIQINNINTGKYYLKEIEVKNGYEKIEDIEFEVPRIGF